mgnify:CR=1 FL=1
MVFKNYYKILDLETSHVSIEEIKQAYRQAAKKYHPDLNVGDTLAEEKIKDINEAYKILSDGFLREQYDKELQKEEDIYNQRVYKQKEKNTNYKADTKKKNRKEDYAQEQMPTHNVGTFMSLVDLVSVTFKNMPKREKRKLQKEDFIAGGLTILIVGILIVVLWFIPATNGFVKSLLPFLN